MHAWTSTGTSSSLVGQLCIWLRGTQQGVFFPTLSPVPQELAALLARLKAGGHKALIFTQMTRMLDILEAFLNLHAHKYVRLDGSTKPETRQVMGWTVREGLVNTRA